jgi:hypothetical protein
VAEPAQRCTHPWLRVTCGVCGEAVDALGGPDPGPAGDASAEAAGEGAPGGQSLFIVARGHPELVEQLKSVLGHHQDVEIIEDRRRRPREAPTLDQARELRKRLREEEDSPA